MTDQPATYGMRDAEFVSQVSSFVYVSEWQLAQFRELYNIEHVQNTVIRNAIDPIPFVPKPDGQIRLIYTSMPDRGLDILLDAYEIVKPGRNVVLDVYSSNIIYGAGYASGEGQKNKDVLAKCRTAPGVNYRGYVTNKAVRVAVQRAHILAYPSTFEETSCLSAIEAGAAGCHIVTTGLGALPETCGPHATYVNSERSGLVERYAKVLADAIDEYTWLPDSQWRAQSAWFNSRYSWEHRIGEWRQFFNSLLQA
jgi:glycosyltransferase involved in cell wall biosynthesis